MNSSVTWLLETTKDWTGSSVSLQRGVLRITLMRESWSSTFAGQICRFAAATLTSASSVMSSLQPASSGGRHQPRRQGWFPGLPEKSSVSKTLAVMFGSCAQISSVPRLPRRPCGFVCKGRVTFGPHYPNQRRSALPLKTLREILKDSGTEIANLFNILNDIHVRQRVITMFGVLLPLENCSAPILPKLHWMDIESFFICAMRSLTVTT